MTKEILNKFFTWFHLKPKLNIKKHKPPFVKEGEIWWIYTGENIGTEISGKGSTFSRPAIIYKKLSQYTFLILPTSTKIKDGSWYVPIQIKEQKSVVCLHQAKSIDYRRLDKIISNTTQSEFIKIQEKFSDLYSCKKNTPFRKI
jgi:mRNA interferase MazF